MRDIGCRTFREQFVTYAWQMAGHGANCASRCRLDRLRATKWHNLARHIAGHCGNKIRASVGLADSAFRAVLTVPEHLLHPLLPPRKKTGYNLRKRSHGLMLSEAKSSFLRNNFLVRMLYTDVYLHFSVFTLLYDVPSLRLSITFNKETDLLNHLLLAMFEQGEYEPISPGISTDPVPPLRAQQSPVQPSASATPPASSAQQHANMRETCHIAIPNYAVGAIIGAAGANIKRIIRDSNAFVTVRISSAVFIICCPINKTQEKSLEFTISRVLMKKFPYCIIRCNKNIDWFGIKGASC